LFASFWCEKIKLDFLWLLKFEEREEIVVCERLEQFFENFRENGFS